jgi:hypothetical protein
MCDAVSTWVQLVNRVLVSLASSLIVSSSSLLTKICINLRECAIDWPAAAYSATAFSCNGRNCCHGGWIPPLALTRIREPVQERLPRPHSHCEVYTNFHSLLQMNAWRYNDRPSALRLNSPQGLPRTIYDVCYFDIYFAKLAGKNELIAVRPIIRVSVN